MVRGALEKQWGDPDRPRKTLLALLAVLLASAQAFAADRHDGNWWNSQKWESHVDYVVGFMDGMDLGENFATWRGVKNGTWEDWANKGIVSYEYYVATYLKNITVKQLIDGMDDFYKDFRNRSVLVTNGIWLVLNQISGKPAPEMEKMIESFRKYQW